MKLTGLHLLLTYRCTLECDHCFVWGSPMQQGVMTLSDIDIILQQAINLGSIKSIYFEGGEPFLYYAVLLKAAQKAASLGFDVGIVTNAYWANSLEDSLANLMPFAGLVQDLSVSSDLFHSDQLVSQQSTYAGMAARQLGISAAVISIARPDPVDVSCSIGQIPGGESGVMYRGRAAETLAGRVLGKPWEEFTTCPHEDLSDPGRVHIDPLGNVHLCQGILLGNIFQASLTDMCASYEPTSHPIAEPLLQGGPAELARRFAVVNQPTYADACHLCYSVRKALLPAMPEALGPGQMYGVGTS